MTVVRQQLNEEATVAALMKMYSNEPLPRKTKVVEKKKPVVTLAPGTVLIMLLGRFKGRRMVYLTQLESGLLLVTGPFSVNGVPLRRVSKEYVQPTSTVLDIKFDMQIDEAIFRNDPAESVSEERKALQAQVDESIVSALDADQRLKSYLKARFSLRDKQYPHMLRF